MPAFLLGNRTERVKATPRRRIERTWNFSAQYDALAAAFANRIRDRDSGHQGMCARVKRIIEDEILFTVFDEASKIHRACMTR
jgi:hypothetical protein